MKLEELYREIVETFGYTVGEYDYILTPKGKNVLFAGHKGVIPTKRWLANLRDADGEVVYPFNMLHENVVNRNPELDRLVKTAEILINAELSSLIYNITKHMYDKSTEVPISIAVIIGKAGEAKGAAKKLVDDKTLELITEMKRWVKVSVRKHVKKEGEKFAAGFTLTPVFLRMVEEDDEDLKHWRRKDKDLVTIILNELLGENTGVISVSSHERWPLSYAFLKGYAHLVRDLKEYSEPLGVSVINDIYYDPKVLGEVTPTQVMRIPTVSDDGNVEETLILNENEPKVNESAKDAKESLSVAETMQSGEAVLIPSATGFKTIVDGNVIEESVVPQHYQQPAPPPPYQQPYPQQSYQQPYGQLAMPYQPPYGQSAPYQPPYGQPVQAYQPPYQPPYGQQPPPPTTNIRTQSPMGQTATGLPFY